MLRGLFEFNRDSTRATDIHLQCHLNLYLVESRYGGPEEGGWWYDAGTPADIETVDAILNHGATFANVSRDYQPAAQFVYPLEPGIPLSGLLISGYYVEFMHAFNKARDLLHKWVDDENAGIPDRYSVISRGDYQLAIESHSPAPWPEAQPFYE